MARLLLIASRAGIEPAALMDQEEHHGSQFPR